jgi:hypothetical protein
MYTEIVVGFDTRLAPNGRAEPWDEARRRLYLLKDVDWPLSVDEAVWLRKNSTMVYGKGLTIETPRFRTAEEARAAAAPDEWAVAITAWTGPGEPEPPDDLGAPDPAWQRLGYDVCEEFFPSGLSNCGYDAEEAEGWRQDWGPALDEHHLFHDLPTAFAFRDATARRVAEHGPFAVMGLYKLRSGS